VLLALWYGFEVLRTTAAENERDDTLDSVQSFKKQQTKFDEMVKTQSQVKAINSQLAALMASDLLWSKLTASAVGVAPDDVDVTGFSAAVPAAGVTTTAPTNLIGPPGVKLLGTLTINGVGPRKDVIALYVDALDTVPGLANAFLTSAAEGEDGFDFSVRVDITTAALDNRYKPSTGASAGAGS
jgi:hypothetical protein